MKKLRLASKVNPPTNALRHSYASYWLARSSKEGLGELSKRMGNSEAVCKRHYLETLTRDASKMATTSFGRYPEKVLAFIPRLKVA
jgi:hypothetical protein